MDFSRFTEENFETLWFEEVTAIKNMAPDLWKIEEDMVEGINAEEL